MFNPFESSRTRGQPLELYEFQIGNDFFRYCNGSKDFVFAGLTYAAVPITRTSITSSGTLDKQTLTVTLAETVSICTKLRSYTSSAVVALTLRQGHKDDPDKQFLVAWVGRVLGAQGNPDDGTRALTCQPASTSLKRIGLRRNWQFGCPHVLYGDQCRADMVRASTRQLPTGRSGRRVDLPANWNGPYAPTKFVGGLAIWDAEVRTIVRAELGYVMLGEPPNFAPGTPITLTLGCNHLRSDCSTLHQPRDEPYYGNGNIRNFGGQPFIPQTNPIGFVSNYS